MATTGRAVTAAVVLVLVSMMIVQNAVLFRSCGSTSWFNESPEPGPRAALLRTDRGTQRYVLLCVDSTPRYMFWLPFTAITWLTRQKFIPVIFIIYNDDQGLATHVEIVRRCLRSLGVDHVFLVRSDRSDQTRMTQHARLYAAMLPLFHSSDWIVTSDADLLPVAIGNGDYYAANGSQAIWLTDLAEFDFYDDIHGHVFKQWPLCNIGMTAAAWRRVMRYSPVASADDFLAIVPQVIVEDLMTMMGYRGKVGHVAGAEDSWFWDQQMFSLRLHAAVASGCIIWERDVAVTKRTNANRIDRIGWPSEPLTAREIDTKFDAHLPRIPDQAPTYVDLFARTEWLLVHVLNDDEPARKRYGLA